MGRIYLALVASEFGKDLSPHISGREVKVLVVFLEKSACFA
jgi:hypothetical protein